MFWAMVMCAIFRDVRSAGLASGFEFGIVLVPVGVAQGFLLDAFPKLLGKVHARLIGKAAQHLSLIHIFSWIII